MNLIDIKNLFLKNKLSKSDYIKLIHKQHKQLFLYQKELKNTEIKKIEINDNSVIFTSRKTFYHSGEIKIIIDRHDKRIPPIEAFNFNKYEPKDSQLLFTLVKDSKVILDIGANIGWYSLHFAKMNPGSTIFSFEPILFTYKKLLKNIELNSLNNIIPVNLGLSNKKGEVEFYYSKDFTGATSSKDILENEKSIKINSKITKLDSFVKERKISKIDFIKCDVEGAELLVIKGGLKSIEINLPILFLEILRKWSKKFNYNPNDIIIALKNLGYNCFVSFDNKLKQISSINDKTTETNFFFLHEEKHRNLF